MAITVTERTVKPADKAWWSVNNAQALAQLKEWHKSFPGIVSVRGSTVDANTVQSVLTFTSMSDYNAYQAATTSNAAFQARKTYNQANGIVTTVTVA
jgi:hypothetical protein